MGEQSNDAPTYQEIPSYQAAMDGHPNAAKNSRGDHGKASITVDVPAVNGQVHARRNSLDKAMDPESNVIWSTGVRSGSISLSTGSDSQTSVQRNGSYRDAVTVERANMSKREILMKKITHGFKRFARPFFPSEANSISPKDGNLVEEPADPKFVRRWGSLWLTWIIMFIVVLQFSMYSSTLGTYLPLIDPTATETFAPWAIAAFGFGQTFACPVFGWWSNRIKNNQLPMAVGLVLMIIGNIGYCAVDVFPADKRKWVVFVFRVIIGVGGGIAGVIRAYCATAARPHEYTKAVTGATAGLALAIMAGPGAQAIFAPIGYPGISIGAFHIHMYNAPALVSIAIGILLIILLYTVLLQEYPGLAKNEQNDRWFVLPKYDVCATWVIIFCWFAAYLTLTSFVMIGKSYTMVMFHWSYVEAVVDNGIIMGVFACISLIIFILYAYHGKKFDERLLMYVGITMMCFFFLITFPWPGLPRLQQECGSMPCCNPALPLNQQDPCVDIHWINKTNLMSVSDAVAKAVKNGGHHDDPSILTTTLAPGQEHEHDAHDNFPGGCQAVKYNWCDRATKEPIGLYMGTFFLLAAGFPLANCAFSALFSKIIGPRRQGFMQGVIISAGAAARTSGPLFINFTFDWWGPRVSWGLTAGILMASIAVAAAYHRRLIPLNPKPKLNPGEYFRYKKGYLYRL